MSRKTQGVLKEKHRSPHGYHSRSQGSKIRSTTAGQQWPRPLWQGSSVLTTLILPPRWRWMIKSKTQMGDVAKAWGLWQPDSIRRTYLEAWINCVAYEIRSCPFSFLQLKQKREFSALPWPCRQVSKHFLIAEHDRFHCGFKKSILKETKMPKKSQNSAHSHINTP